MEPPVPTPNPNPNPTPTPSPTPNPTPTPAPLAGADGVLSANWLQHEKIPADLRTDKTLATIKDVGTLASMLVNAEKAIGKKRAVVPTDPQNKAELDEYFALAGWPKDGPDKYPTVAPPADMPKGLKEDPELTKSWRQWCHEARLTPEQMVFLSQKVLGWNVASHKLAEADAVQAQQTAQTELRNEWQAKYDVNVQLANTAAAAFCNEKELAYAQAAGWLADPMFLRIMNKVGGAVSPDRLHARSDGGIDTGGIERQIAELETSDPYRKPENPRHQAVTQQVLQLREQLINAKSRR